MPSFVSIGMLPLIRSYPLHQHESWELVLYTHGRGVATIGEREISFHPGRLICMPPGVPHKEISEHGYRDIYIHAHNVAASDTIPVVDDTEDRRLFRLAMMLYSEAHLKPPGWETGTQDLLDLFLFFVRRGQAPKEEHALVARLKMLLVEHLHDSDFRVGAAMREMPMASDHLRRLFRQVTGRTPLDYLSELRVAEAKRLLKVGGLGVKQVAARVGIPDPYYFSRVFMKVTGRRPSAYLRTGSPERDAPL
ncbi:MAG TPA: AraC family transcriptional regulator [Candidatus Binataceae bacterium]|nr:AraC family transcriptional regulator [Candidatus Binataceae bacterium]